LDRGERSPPLSRPAKYVHIVLLRQQKPQKADTFVTARLTDAQQHEIITQPGFLQGPLSLLSVVCKLLDAILRIVVIPGHSVVFEEREQILSILGQAWENPA